MKSASTTTTGWNVSRMMAGCNVLSEFWWLRDVVVMVVTAMGECGFEAATK